MPLTGAQLRALIYALRHLRGGRPVIVPGVDYAELDAELDAALTRQTNREAHDGWKRPR